MKILFFIAIAIFSINTCTFSQTILKPLPLSSLTFGGKTLSFEDTTVWAPFEQKYLNWT